MIVLFNKTIVKLDEYERNVEADIRKLKTRLALVTEARNRKVKKLENIKNLPPERIVFGGKKLPNRSLHYSNHSFCIFLSKIPDMPDQAMVLT